ncbi:hypothetical protein C8F01DRAFT_1373127 [Mycena amicta]|nr:hypothetical protein C8F01DRAFT_1373127 [Mycena amicta]
MPPSLRKQTTYAHKRNRTKAMPAVSASSPLPDHVDDVDDHYLSHAELSSRLKRARRSSNPELPSSKRLRSSKPTPAASPKATPAASPSYFETPYPSLLTEEQKFKLNSSRPVHPDQVSPFPDARPITSRTSSRKQKENASLRTSKKAKFLDSPFNSRPGSTVTSPQKTMPSPEKKSFKRTLSDTNYNPNIPQSASTANSPAYIHSSIRARRPSAPSPPRPGDWLRKDHILSNLDLDLQNAFANPFFFPTDVDFNRPPSSLSMYGDSDHFFDDAQGVSTPASQRGAYRVPPAGIDTDDELDDVMQDAMDVDATVPAPGPRLKDFPRERSPWLSDSLISPPNSQEWNDPSQKGAYIRSPVQDVDMEDELSLGLGLGPPLPADNQRPGDLKQMFDGLAIGSKNLFGSRTRSLDSTAHHAPAEPTESGPKSKGRDRRGTIRASDFVKNPGGGGGGAGPTAAGLARRTRSGTVIGPPAQRDRARSLDRGDVLGQVDEGEELGGWCAEDWAVAAPPSPLLTRKPAPRSQRRVSVSWSMLSMDELDFLPRVGKLGGAGLMPAPVLQVKRSVAAAVGKGKGKEKEDVVMEEDEEDDELLLKPGMHWD